MYDKRVYMACSDSASSFQGAHVWRNKVYSFPFLMSSNLHYQYFLVVRGTQNPAQNYPLRNKLQSDYCSTTISSHTRVLISLLKDRGIIEAISSLQIDYQATLIPSSLAIWILMKVNGIISISKCVWYTEGEKREDFCVYTKESIWERVERAKYSCSVFIKIT